MVAPKVFLLTARVLLSAFIHPSQFGFPIERLLLDCNHESIKPHQCDRKRLTMRCSERLRVSR